MVELSDWPLQLRECMRRGRFGEAHALLRAEPAADQAKTHAQTGLIVARYLNATGYQGSARRLMRHLRETAPEHKEVEARWACLLVEDRRLVEAARWMQDTAQAADWPEEDLPALWRAHFSMHLSWRDFEQAKLALERATEAGLSGESLASSQVELLLEQSRLEEALAVTHACEEQYPERLRPAHQSAWLLYQLDRAPEALAKFAALCERSDYLPLWAGYAGSLADQGREHEAIEVLERAIPTASHYAPKIRRSSTFFLAHLAARIGDQDRVQRYAQRLGEGRSDFWSQVEPGEQAVQILQLPFQKQDFVTCAPASAAAILGYFERHIDHREIASQITYDGTRDSDLVQWLENAGFKVRPFQLQAGTANTLIERGLPFSIGLKGLASGHRTTAIGVNRAARSVILLDPSNRYHSEVSEEGLIEQQNALGEYSLLILPATRADDFADLQLPQEERARTLLDHEAAAVASDLSALDRLQKKIEAWPDDALTWHCKTLQAWARGDRSAHLAVARNAEQAESGNWFWADRLASSLGASGQWKELDRRLQEWTRRPGCPATFWTQHGVRQESKPGGHVLAWQAYEKAARSSSLANAPLDRMAGLLQNNPETRPLASAFARMHTCLHPHEEGAALRYADLCVRAGDRALADRFLHARCTSLTSAAPVITYASWLASEHRRDEAIQLLQQAPRQDPVAHRDLLAALFEHYCEHHRIEDAASLICEHESLLRPQQLTRMRFQLLKLQGKNDEAIATLELLVQEGQARDEDWDELLPLLHATRGAREFRQRVRAEIGKESCDSSFLGAAWNFCLWLKELPLAHELVNRLVQLEGDTVFARKLWTRTLHARGRHEEALQAAQELLEADPFAVTGWLDLARSQQALGDSPAAQNSLRRLFEIQTPSKTAYELFIETADGLEERRMLIEEMQARALEEEPDAQMLGALTEDALRQLPPRKVADWLDAICTRYPFRPEFAAPRIEALNGLGEHEKALAVARLAWEQKPNSPSIAFQLGVALLGLRDLRQVCEFLAQVREQYVDSAQLAKLHLVAYERAEDNQSALEVAQQAWSRFPAEEDFALSQSSLLWQLDQKQESVDQLSDFCLQHPVRFDAWHTLLRRLRNQGQQERGLQLAEQLVQLSPVEPESHAVLARAYRYLDRQEEQLEALDTAAALDPESLQRICKLARLHGQLKDFRRAKELLSGARERLGESAALLHAESQIFREEGHLEVARDTLRHSLELEPEQGGAWSLYCQWLRLDGCTGDLIALAKDPPKALRESERLQYDAGCSLEESDRDEEALRYFQRAASLAPDNEYLWCRLLRAYRYIDDWGGLRVAMQRDFKLQALASENLSEVLVCYAFLDHPQLLPALQETLTRSDLALHTWVDLSRALTQTSHRGELIKFALDQIDAQTPIAPAANVVSLLSELAFESSKRRRLRHRLRSFLEHFASHYAKHPQLPQQLQRIFGGPRAPSDPVLRAWAKQNLTQPPNHAGLIGVLGYLLSPRDPRWLLDHLAPPFGEESFEPWMALHFIDAALSCGQLELADQWLAEVRAVEGDSLAQSFLSAEAELRLLRGDAQWVLDHARKESELLNFRDCVRDTTLNSLAAAALSDSGRRRRQLYRQWLRHTADRVTARSKGVPMRWRRDLKPLAWARTIRRPWPLLLYFGDRYLFWKKSDDTLWIHAT